MLRGGGVGILTAAAKAGAEHKAVIAGLKSVGENLSRPSSVCVVATLSPRWGLRSLHFLPSACAVGCILTLLRGSTQNCNPSFRTTIEQRQDHSGT